MNAARLSLIFSVARILRLQGCSVHLQLARRITGNIPVLSDGARVPWSPPPKSGSLARWKSCPSSLGFFVSVR
jgi:hypothetical protein